MPGLKTRQRFWEATGRQAGSKVRAGRRRESFFKKGKKEGGGKKRAKHFAGAAVGRVHAPDKLMFK